MNTINTNEREAFLFPREIRCPIDFSNLQTHLWMLRNASKYRIFSNAFAKVVKNKRVLDIGTGSGILALISAANGASSVVAVERLPMSGVARAVFQAYPRTCERIHLMEGNCFDLDLGVERFDVIVSETIGYLGYEENIAPILYTARNRWARPSAALVPRELEIIPELLTFPLREAAAPWLTFDRVPASSLKLMRASLPFELGSSLHPKYPIWAAWQASADVELYAMAVYFRAVLTGGLSLTNKGSGGWPHCLIPFTQPISVAAGKEIICGLTLKPNTKSSYNVILQVKVSGQQLREQCFETTEIQAREVTRTHASADRIISEVDHLLNMLNLKSQL